MKKEGLYTLLGTLSQNAFSKLQSAGYRFVEQLKVENEEIKKERVVLTRSP